MAGARRRLIAIAALFALPALASDTPGTWSLVATPNSRPTPSNNLLSGVTCVTSSDCWAVGWYNKTIGTTQTLIQHWDGAAWSIVESPNTHVTQDNVLRAVSCAATDDCWAVGSYNADGVQQTLALHWDGAAWTRFESPDSSDSEYNALADVACASSSSCWAVGGHTLAGVYQTLIEHWDGEEWTIVDSPDTSTAQENLLAGVDCASATDCWAVGHAISASSGFAQTLVQRWNGTAWSIVTSANGVLSTDNRLVDVTCTAASDCWAAGTQHNGIAEQTLVEHWNGSAWSVAASANSSPSEANVLQSIACAAANDCWAVGRHGEAAQTLVERWNGSSWTIADSPNASGALDSTLLGVACPAVGDCRAAGFATVGTLRQALVENWNGSTWTLATAVNANAVQNNTLLGIECVEPADCWAVASYFNGSVQQTLVQHWNGSRWSIVDSPNTAASQSNILYDASCTSSSDCWIVGYAVSGVAFQTLAMHWDGETWSIVATPNADVAQNNFLTDVTCVSASDCWAIGYYDTGVAYQTLALHWDGSDWSLVATPNTDVTRENRLLGVACASSTDCWAVGRYFNGTLIQTLAARWNGTEWSMVDSPNTDALQENNLYGVTCVTATDCWAVGYWGTGSGTGQPLLERWDGTSWSIVESPLPTQQPQYNYNFLRSVDCPAPDECWAVGYTFIDGYYQSLIERWDGETWSIVPSPNTSPEQSNQLIGLSCPSVSGCMAAGYYTDAAGVLQTLAARYHATLSAPVVAQLGADPVTGTAPLLVAFDGSASVAPAGAIYAFSFGDGSEDQVGTDPTASHEYEAGDFLAVLTVTDPGDPGNSSQASVAIHVTAPPDPDPDPDPNPDPPPPPPVDPKPSVGAAQPGFNTGALPWTTLLAAGLAALLRRRAPRIKYNAGPERRDA